MGKNTIIAILFAGNADNIYFTGQAVSGHVHVQTTEAVKMRGIRLEFHGSANVRWTEGSGDDEKSYTGNEEFVNLYLDLMGSRSKDSELILQPGTYDLPFTFILTSDLPSSFVHHTGQVRYIAKAVIDRPLRIDDTAEVALTVVRSLDLNLEPPQFREPVVVQSQNPASGCCCVSGTPEIDITLNKGLFTVGETILAQGEISNRTNTRIKYSAIALIQVWFPGWQALAAMALFPQSSHKYSGIMNFTLSPILSKVHQQHSYYRIQYIKMGRQELQFCATYITNGTIYRTETAKKVLAKLERPEIAPGRSDSWSNIAFVIPPVPSSRLDGCKIINISYYVEVAAVFNACCNISSARAGLIIGNVPLSYDFHSSVITSQPQPSMMPSALPIKY